MKRGQFIRLFLSSDNTTTPAAVIASAKTLSLHVACTVEAVTTKDTEGDWVANEVTGYSFDISTNALVSSGETITSSVTGKTLNDLQEIYEAAEPVKFQIAEVSGDNQRTKGTVYVQGSVVVSQLTINAAVSQAATYDTQLQGHGDYEVPN